MWVDQSEQNTCICETSNLFTSSCNKSMPTALVVAPDMSTYLLKYFKSSKLHRVSEWKLNYP